MFWSFYLAYCVVIYHMFQDFDIWLAIFLPSGIPGGSAPHLEQIWRSLWNLTTFTWWGTLFGQTYGVAKTDENPGLGNFQDFVQHYGPGMVTATETFNKKACGCLTEDDCSWNARCNVWPIRYGTNKKVCWCGLVLAFGSKKPTHIAINQTLMLKKKRSVASLLQFTLIHIVNISMPTQEKKGIWYQPRWWNFDIQGICGQFQVKFIELRSFWPENKCWLMVLKVLLNLPTN